MGPGWSASIRDLRSPCDKFHGNLSCDRVASASAALTGLAFYKSSRADDSILSPAPTTSLPLLLTMESSQPFTQALIDSDTSTHAAIPQQSYPASTLDSILNSAPIASTSTAILTDEQPQPPPAIALTGFAAARSLAAARPNPVPYTEPPLYVPAAPSATIPTPGIAAHSGTKRILTKEEEARMKPDELRVVLQTAGLLKEEDVQAMSVAQLKKMGLGRTPSGEC